MRYLSVCAGIEAATVAWHPLGWQPAAFSEIEAFPSAVLAHHYPDVPNWGDMTKFKEWPDADVDVLVGGTPCQSFSVAGLRKGMDDPRGNLALTYLAIAARYRPQWLVWENVPGVLSSNKGRDFGSILGGMVELGYGFAYRVLDAQYAGVPQRRRRIFVVGYLGDWRRAAAVLFEQSCLLGNPPPSRKARQTAPTIPSRRTAGGGTPLVTAFYPTNRQPEFGNYEDVSPAIKIGSSGSSGNPPAIAFQTNTNGDDGMEVDGISVTLKSKGMPAVAFLIMPMNSGKDYKARETDVAQPIMAGGPVGGNQGGDFIKTAMQVRRLTPRECERLQGFPDDYSLVPYRGKPAADGPRYRALGNSMAVPCMRWIGERIAMVEKLTQQESA